MAKNVVGWGYHESIASNWSYNCCHVFFVNAKILKKMKITETVD